ncbi:MAG: c-type cytochrome [Desulfuromonadales bacterium]
MLEDHEHKHAVHEFDGIIENRVSSPPVYFTVLFYGLIIWGVAFSAFYLLSGWSSDAEFQAKMQAHDQLDQSAAAMPATGSATPATGPGTETPPKEPAPATSTAAAAAPADGSAPDAKALYAAKCAMCHGADAKGGFGPDLTTADSEYGKNREALFHTISEGRANNKMPAFKDQLKRPEIYALADYLLSLGKPAEEAVAAPAAEPEKSASAPDAKALYAAKCAMCHGADAKGGFGPDLTAADYQFGKTREAIVETITEGRGNGKMPAFGSQLKQDEIDALASYLQSL